MPKSNADLRSPMPFRSCYATCLGVELHYTDWGPQDAPVILMAHGLARTGRDFDDIAYLLSPEYRVICPDMLGRGLSEWATNPHDYQLTHYVALITELLDQLQINHCRWLGTSMGGATGIVAAAHQLKHRISHLVINDIGPELAPAAIERILAYVGKPPHFKRVTELEQWLQQVYEPYGWQSPEQWRRMADSSARRLDNGAITAHYDPLIVQQFVQHPKDYERYDEFASLSIPIAVLRGEKSDLLTLPMVEKMQGLQPQAIVQQFANCGHAPALNVKEQIQFIQNNFKH